MLVKILFESSLMLLAVWIPIQFGLISLWSWQRGRSSAHAAWAGLAVFPVVLGISHWVVTDREEVIHLCQELAKAIDEGDLDSIQARLAPDFRAGEWDTDMFLHRARQTLIRYHVDDPRLSGFEWNRTSSNEGSVGFQASARVSGEEFSMDRLATRWRLHCRRAGHGWQVTRIEALPVPPLNIRGLADLLR